MRFALLGFLRGHAYVRVEHEEINLELFRTYNPATMKWSEHLEKPEDVLIKLLVEEDWVGFAPPVEFETEDTLMTFIHSSQHGLPAALAETVRQEILEDFRANNQKITTSLFSEKFHRIMGEKLGKLHRYGLVGEHHFNRWETKDSLHLDVKVALPVQAKRIHVTVKPCRDGRLERI